MQTEINFHNSIMLQEPELQMANQKAKTQDQLVLDVFENQPERNYTPCEIYKIMMDAATINYSTPLTSIRRAISNLTEAGKLYKTVIKRKGIYGLDNNTWQIINSSINF